MTAPSPTLPATASRRVEVFDGLRGIAIVLVVLSHGWALWPIDYVSTHRPLSTLFTSGNFAVSIFFAVGTFVATVGMLRRAGSAQGLHPAVDVVRRWVRLSGQVAFMLLVLLLVLVFDDSDTNGNESTRTSVVRILTYSWNWYLQGHAVTARSDLGHLWFLSVYLQSMALVVGVVWLLRRRPGWLVVTLASLLVLVEVWGRHVYATEGVVQALLRSTVRIDAPLAGALAAAALPYLARLRGHAPAATATAAVGLSTAVLVPLAYLCSTNKGYFSAPGVLLNLVLCVFVASAAVGPVPRALTLTLGTPVLTFLGSRSLGLYIWHYPVFFYVARHAPDWHWGWRTALALALTLACVLVSERFVESRVQRSLQSPAWRQLDYGFPAFLRRRIRSMRESRELTRSSDKPRRRFARS